MRRHIHHQMTERAAACLSCACEDERNDEARKLMQRTGAASATGVIAAIAIGGDEHVEIVELARVAITAQREICREHGPFVPKRCGEHGLAALQRK